VYEMIRLLSPAHEAAGEDWATFEYAVLVCSR
jgi:hypothetical protein